VCRSATFCPRRQNQSKCEKYVHKEAEQIIVLIAVLGVVLDPAFLELKGGFVAGVRMHSHLCVGRVHIDVEVLHLVDYF